MIKLENSRISIAIYEEAASFSLMNKEDGLEMGPVSVDLSLSTHGAFCSGGLLTLRRSEPLHDAKREGQGLRLEYDGDGGAWALELELFLSAQSPFLLQRMRLRNFGAEELFIDRLTMARTRLPECLKGAEACFYANGWQSWSPSGTYGADESQLRSRLGVFTHPMIYNPGTPITQRSGHFSADMFALLGNRRSRRGLLCGFLSQKHQFGSIEADLKGERAFLQVWAGADGVRLRAGQSLETDWLGWQAVSLDDSHPFESYFDAVALENDVKQRANTPVGWCSWYYYFQKISAMELRKNLAEISELREELPLELLQLDDGYQQDVGSWLKHNDKFPGGTAPLAHEIREAGLQPGLWMAPFIVERKSRLVQEHPEWLLRGVQGRGRANSGFVWNNLGYALDLTLDAVRAYVHEVVHTAVYDWGFSYLKLDFLYAACVRGSYHDQSLTRAQVLRMGLELIRDAAGEETILSGCGCPLGPALGLMDTMRISCDVAPNWLPKMAPITPFIRQEPNFPSTRNALRNILNRTAMDPAWWVNDPDCLMIREDSDLSLDEIRALATAISLSGGALLFSDDFSRLGAEPLRMAKALLPVLPPGVSVPDLFDTDFPSRMLKRLSGAEGDWTLLALFNWENEAQELEVRAEDLGFERGQQLIAREFWSGELFCFQDILKLALKPHGVALLAIRDVKNQTRYLGSNLHISGGMELEAWEESAGGLHFTLKANASTDAYCDLHIPWEPAQFRGEQGALQALAMGHGLWRLPVNGTDRLHFEVLR